MSSNIRILAGLALFSAKPGMAAGTAKFAAQKEKERRPERRPFPNVWEPDRNTDSVIAPPVQEVLPTTANSPSAQPQSQSESQLVSSVSWIRCDEPAPRHIYETLQHVLESSSNRVMMIPKDGMWAGPGGVLTLLPSTGHPMLINLQSETRRPVSYIKAFLYHYFCNIEDVDVESIPKWRYAFVEFFLIPKVDPGSLPLSDEAFVEATNEYFLAKAVRAQEGTLEYDIDEIIEFKALPDLSCEDTYDPSDHKAVYHFEKNLRMLESFSHTLNFHMISALRYARSECDEPECYSNIIDSNKDRWMDISTDEDNTFAYILYYHPNLNGDIIFRKYRTFNGEIKTTTYRIWDVQYEDERRHSRTKLSRFEPDRESDATFLSREDLIKSIGRHQLDQIDAIGDV